MGHLRSYTLAFVMGFSCCALTARFLLPVPAAATSRVTFTSANPAEVVDSVGETVVSLEAFPSKPEVASEGLWPRLLGTAGNPDPEPSTVASGVVVSNDGYIVTNNHVVADGGKIRARFPSGKEFGATVVGSDPMSDLAVLKIPARHLHAAPLGNSRSVRSGDNVVAIGNPLGFENSVSVGVVSANRSGPLRIDGHTLGDMIQTDAAINQGNSGGGLFTADGRLIGINTAIMVPKGGSGSIGIGFAIPVHRMRPIVDNLIAKGRVPRPWLGIKYRTPQVASFVRRVRKGVGVLVEDVLPNSPAAQAGLRPADIVRQLGDCDIHSSDDIYHFVDRYQPGQKVKARVLRGGTEKTLILTLGEKTS
jgi:S1-C subfamily serine protease